MNSGANIIMSEGNTEVSKHMARYDHEKDDVTIKAVAFDTNWYTRGVREAIEIKKRKPTLNADNGRFHLNPIYDLVLKSTKKNENEAVTRVADNSTQIQQP